MTTPIQLATFATAMRAASLVEDLAKAGIQAQAVQPKWFNKKLPPPRIKVMVEEADRTEAVRVLGDFVLDHRAQTARKEVNS